MKNIIKPRRKFFFIIPVILLFAVTGIVMWLWNMVLPNILEVKTITYWQAMGILILSKILFGGFCGFKKHHHNIHKNNFFHKLKNMTQEEREKFKDQWKQRFSKEGFCNHK